MAEVRDKGYRISFDVLYYATRTNLEDIKKEIGEKESEFINKYLPILNTQIPNEGDFQKYTNVYHDAREIVEYIIS